MTFPALLADTPNHTAKRILLRLAPPLPDWSLLIRVWPQRAVAAATDRTAAFHHLDAQAIARRTTEIRCATEALLTPYARAGTEPPTAIYLKFTQAAVDVLHNRPKALALVPSQPDAKAYYAKQVERLLRSGLHPEDVVASVLQARKMQGGYLRDCVGPVYEVEEQDPVVAKAFGLEQPGRYRMPVIDVRSSMLRSREPFKVQPNGPDMAVPIYGLIASAAPFHRDNILKAVGPAFASMLAYVGWDTSGGIYEEREWLAIGLRHEAYVHECVYLKGDLLKRLQTIPQLQHAKGITLFCGEKRAPHQGKARPWRRRSPQKTTHVSRS